MSTFSIKQGDYHRRLLLDLEGLDAADSTGVTFRMRNRRSGELVLDRAGLVNSASQVSLQFESPELDTPGLFDLEAALQFPDGSETVPTVGFVLVSVESKLG